MQLIQTPQPDDLSWQRGIDAYRWMSMSPERRAEADQAAYVADVLGFAAELEAIATSEVQLAVAVAEVEAFRLKYINWQTILWAAKSRTASPMVTGPARFPVARNNKAMDAEQKKITAFLDWLKKASKGAAQRVQRAGQTIIDQPPAAASESVTVAGVEIVKNFELERVQILFGGKPDAETIAALKGEGWNWSPRNMAWQRKLTDAAFRSANRIVAA